MKPSLEDYLSISENHAYVPLYIRLMGDTITPVQVYQAVRNLSPYSYLLESVQQNEKLGRYSWLGLDPLMVFVSNGTQITLKDCEGTKTLEGNPLDVLFEIMEEYRPALCEDLLPFEGGLVGYFGYDMIRQIERIPDENPDEVSLPESVFIIPKTVFVFDHLYQSVSVISLVPSGDETVYNKGRQELMQLIDSLSKSSFEGSFRELNDITEDSFEFDSNMTRESYLEAVKKAKNYIVEGDIFQVVLSQRFSTDFDGDPFEVYRSLRRINPSPYLFYLNFPDFQVAGSSPEILVKRQKDTLTLRPIAGTRKRGATLQEDEALADEMMNDPKELAEHMMLVDLGRNDLGRVSEFGSVRPTQFKYIENYSHVMHIVTNLEGQIKPEKSNSDLVKATFPAGTLTGAPKVRAMEIIDELEVAKRGFYGGAVANIDFAGNFDSCIGIRSVVMKNSKAYIQAGAGIVADSEPEKEYEECLNKAKAVMKAIQFVRR